MPLPEYRLNTPCAFLGLTGWLEVQRGEVVSRQDLREQAFRSEVPTLEGASTSVCVTDGSTPLRIDVLGTNLASSRTQLVARCGGHQRLLLSCTVTAPDPLAGASPTPASTTPPTNATAHATNPTTSATNPTAHAAHLAEAAADLAQVHASVAQLEIAAPQFTGSQRAGIVWIEAHLGGILSAALPVLVLRDVGRAAAVHECAGHLLGYALAARGSGGAAERLWPACHEALVLGIARSASRGRGGGGGPVPGSQAPPRSLCVRAPPPMQLPMWQPPAANARAVNATAANARAANAPACNAVAAFGAACQSFQACTSFDRVPFSGTAFGGTVRVPYAARGDESPPPLTW